MRFVDFVDFLDRIGATKSKNAKVSIASELLRNLEPKELSAAVYLMRGRVFSIYDQRELNIGWSTIWGVISRLSRIQPDSLARILKETGDLGLMSERALTKKKLTLLHTREIDLTYVYKELRRMANLTGPGSTRQRARSLLGILGNVSPIESRYIVRIIVGEMRYGFQEGLLEEAISNAFDVPLGLVRRANMLTSDLGSVAEMARESPDGLRELGIEPFRPVRHMLAEPASSIEEALNYHNRKVSIEWKYDGCRLQVHKARKKVGIYSRKLEDVTGSFPEMLSEFSRIEHDFVIDGEAIHWDRGKPGAFQYLIRRLRRKRDIDKMARKYPSKFFAFDILFLDGVQLIDEPYAKRREILETAIPSGQFVTCSERFEYESVEKTMSLFRSGLDLGYEGLVIKNLDSTYKPGKRGRHWFKYKEALETLDLVVLMAEYGHGSRAGLLSDYTFGAWNRERIELIPVGKAYSGLTDDGFEEMTKRLSTITIREAGTRVYVKPQVVMEVAFGDIQKSPRYSSGFALRFPRIKAIRYDLGLDDVDSVQRIEQIYNSQKRK
ncbi:MAG: ATP-dependent DNA ligase [Candidatus Bathyarchaeia archaeon]